MTVLERYPHIEGTLHRLFDGVDQKAKDRIMFGAFNELFPDAPPPPDAGR
ncbi:MAG TPA: hypothetical protein VG187_00020 [Mycobacterium sp.]|nr:hypothetical protein [Mycobacterium sp.]